VVRSQRDRLLDAIAQACAAEGYGDATVAAGNHARGNDPGFRIQIGNQKPRRRRAAW
jgi:hypothetical protein